jgi:hypothetical protein
VSAKDTPAGRSGGDAKIFQLFRLRFDGRERSPGEGADNPPTSLRPAE